MTIEHLNNGKKGLYLAIEDGVKAGQMSYTWTDESKFIIDHTEVDPAFGGKGIGKKLVMEAVNMAREKKVKILPLCPFAAAVFDKVKELQDVLF